MVSGADGSRHDETTAGRHQLAAGWELLICEDDDTRVVALPASGELEMGRAEGAAIVVRHRSVSREHAVLHVGGGFEIEDLGSANGTRVDGVLVAPGARLPVPVGAIVELGEIRMIRRPAAADPSTAMSRARELVERVAGADISVILVGESGVGKEVLASEIHRRSARGRGPFLQLNCAAFPANLLESELFGYERGAFTGAVQSKKGLFEAANGGTVLLDEIGELAPELQPKLLRVLESREVLRVGGLRPVPVDVRFLSATHRELDVLVVLGAFRHDLFFRLNGMSVRIPALRDRVSEIPNLAASLLSEAASRTKRPPMALSSAALELLRSYRWPGNVRELRNVLDRAVLLCDGDRVEARHLVFDRVPQAMTSPSEPASSPVSSRNPPAPSAVSEREQVLSALERCGGNQTEAAKALGITRRILGYRLDKLGIRRPRKG